MKKLFFLFLFFLVSCSKEITVSYELKKEYEVYAINAQTLKKELVTVDYPINNGESIFLLYTIYQNYLPIGYYSNGSPNISLFKVEEKNSVLYYTVDKYIYLTDIFDFKSLLDMTVQLFAYQEVHFIINNMEIC